MLAVWCVFAPLAAWKRCAVGSAVALAWFLAWGMGGELMETIGTRKDLYSGPPVTAIAFCLPLMILSVQLPFWILRWWLRWRVQPHSTLNRSSAWRPLRISDLIVATATVSMALAAARFAEGLTQVESLMSNTLVWAGVTAMASTVILVPAVAAVLRFGTPWCMSSAVVCAYVSIANMPPAMASHGDDLPPWVMHMFVSGISFGFIGSFCGFLLAFRLLGYRLEWGLGRTSDQPMSE